MNGRVTSARGQEVAVAATSARDSAGAFPLTITQCLVAAGSGLLISAGFLRPELHPLAWISFTPLLWLLRRSETRRQAVWAAFITGFVTNLMGFYWLVHTMSVFGGFPVPVAIVFYAGLTSYSAAQFVLFALGVRRTGFALLGLAPALLWVALEFLYPNIFPWRMANTQLHLPVLLQVGDLGGPFPLSLAILWVNAGIVLALERPRRFAPLLGALALVAAIAGYGLIRTPQIEEAMRAAAPFRVGLVQGNVSIAEKGNATFFEINLERYRQLSREIQDEVDLLIWPESVSQTWIPADATSIPLEDHPFPDLKTHLVYGGLAYRYTADGTPEAFNSAFLLESGGVLLGRYDKHILLPFGEYLPGSTLFPFLKRLSPHTGDFTAGRGITTFRVKGAVLGPLICYEDIVIGIPREMTRAGAQILFNILNDAWFGDSAGPYEHQALALWRAVENRRPLLRASNSGVTSVIDPLGRVVGEVGTFRSDVLVREVHPLSLLSFYTRFGDVFAWAVVIAAAGLLLATRRAGQAS